MRRWLKRIGLLILVSLAAQQLWMHLERRSAWTELETELVEVDAADPGWRWEDLEAKRRVVPPEKNSAAVLKKAFAALPINWLPKALDELNEVPPPMGLPEGAVTRLNDELAELEPALIEARTLVDYPAGRFPLQLADDWLSTLVPEQANARSVATALTLDLRRCLHERDIPAACARLRAVLHVAKAFDDEPMLISQLIRMAIQTVVVEHLERTLAQGEAKLSDLDDLQRRLAGEAAAPMFVVALRGERAGLHAYLSNIASGKISLSQSLESLGRKKPGEPTLWNRLNDYFAMTMVLRSHVWLLRYQTRLIDAAQQGDGFAKYLALQEIVADLDELKGDRSLIMAHLFAPALDKMAHAEQRADTLLACAQAGLAAERFRLTQGRWPASLAELVDHKLLDALPEDSFDGQPLRFRAAEDGIVIWSIGKDLSYPGDALDNLRNFDPQFIRVEFRLWNPDRRRQPPLPPKRPADDDIDALPP